jgi:hypothetical protein
MNRKRPFYLLLIPLIQWLSSTIIYMQQISKYGGIFEGCDLFFVFQFPGAFLIGEKFFEKYCSYVNMIVFPSVINVLT